MATPWNMSIPPLTEGQRVEDWQPIFLAATSALVTASGEKAAIQMLPSFLIRHEYERAIVLEAIKEETLAAAFELIRLNLDSEIDMYDAALRYRNMTWCVGERIDDFVTRLWKEAKRSQHTTKQMCVTVVTQLPEEVRPTAKIWINGKGDREVTDKEAREFIRSIQETLKQKGFPLDYGARASGKPVAKQIKEKQPEIESDNESPVNSDQNETVHTIRVEKGRKPLRNPYTRGIERSRNQGCFTCGKNGHGWKFCPERSCGNCGRKGHDTGQCRVRRSNWQGPKGPDKILRTIETGDDEKSVTINLKVGSQWVSAILDTGAKPSVMDSTTLEKLRLRKKLVPVKSQVYGICNAPVLVKGYVDVEVMVPGEESTKNRIYVLEDGEPTLLLGRQFLQNFRQVTFYWEEGMIGLGHTKLPILSTASGGDPLLRAQVVRKTETETPNWDGHQGLTTSEQQQLADLLEEFSEVFSERPGRTGNCEHVIDTGTSAPNKMRPYRLPPRWEEEVNTQMDEMLAQNICRPSSSPWASNVVLVAKKDGRQRFAIDYRRLNDVTKKDAYSIPNIQSILDKLYGSHYYSVIDISSAYWCVPVREADIEKTAFNTPRGLHEMLVMPFGLVNSQATFQRLMDTTFQGIKRIESYIDDGIIFSRSFPEHMQDLRKVFQRLRSANIHLKRTKCCFVQSEVEFLGHRVSRGGRRPLVSAQEKLSKFPRPQSVKELQRFLGSLNYYRSYIPNLAQTAEPLYKLTKTGAPWVWLSECEAAFNHLRKSLVENPIMLSFPNWSNPFVVETDASATGVAGVLSQRDEFTGKLHPIDFFSSALNPSQRNYAAGQLETWALVAAVRKWNVYLRAASMVEIVTDHNPLRWLRQQKDPRHTYARWLLELEEIPYKIIYRPGSQNQLPDYLSRVPDLDLDREVNDEGVFESKICYFRSQEDDILSFRKAQLVDPPICNAIEQLKSGNTLIIGQFKRVAKHIRLRNGVLCFDDRIVLPKQRQREVFLEVHAAGHFGQDRTLKMLKRSYFWTKMSRDTKIWCNECLTCQRSKASNSPKVPLADFLREDLRPGDFVAMDIATLPWSDNEFRYFLLIVDVFSRYIEAIPLKDQRAGSLVQEFKNGWIFRGHGVPKILLSDQAKNIDGSEIRTLCEELGIEKRHSTPYHPQADGLAERSIGLVKQVARCLTIERRLDKGSWPGLLPEITFYANNVENASTQVSPHLLMYGRQPTSPIDARIVRHSQNTTTEGPQDHLEKLRAKKEELYQLARESDEIARKRAKVQYDKCKKSSPIREGDQIFLSNETRSDSLDPKFDGPFRVLQRKGAVVKVQKRNQDKWVHLNRCKLYRGGGSVSWQGSGGDHNCGGSSSQEVEEEVTRKDEAHHTDSNHAENLEGAGDELGSDVNIEGAGEDVQTEQPRRYPVRNRKPVQWHDEYISWTSVPGNWWKQRQDKPSPN